MIHVFVNISGALDIYLNMHMLRNYELFLNYVYFMS